MFCAKEKDYSAAAWQQPELHAVHTKISCKGISAFLFVLERMNNALYCEAPR